ncbi:MAG TPA: lipase, partial [Candidatus Dormibacteraeota bacterium]|nr:lipase [Candidatus Dormibacteraeota bacterium]
MVALALTGLVAAPLLATTPVAAVGTVSLQATFTSVSYGWTKVERWKDTGTGWPTEHYLGDGRMDQTGQRKTFFGTGEPPAANFLMYYAPGWNTGSKAVPVLLVPGAADNVDREYANPSIGPQNCGASSCPSTGLMQNLSGAGYRVFGVQFANTQDDNYTQAQTISDAIGVIKSDLGVSQVDVIAWSKGVIPARMYAASVKPSWGRSYQNDIRKLILLGGP